MTEAMTQVDATTQEHVDQANAGGRTPVEFIHAAPFRGLPPLLISALTIDSGRREVADTALAFGQRFVK